MISDDCTGLYFLILLLLSLLPVVLEINSSVVTTIRIGLPCSATVLDGGYTTLHILHIRLNVPWPIS